MKYKYILILCVFFFFNELFANYEKSVVRINSKVSIYDYTKPWKKAKEKTVIGSGVILENKYILTAAHVVLNAKVIEVKKSNDSKKYYGKIKYISPQADLALIEMYKKSFFKETEALRINKSVKEKDKIKVVGYSLGGNNFLVKKGYISKIKYHPYDISNEEFESLQIKAEINPGDSGGAVLNNKDEILGISIQRVKDSKNIGYAVPSSIINTFLRDIKDKKVDGFHGNSNIYQNLDNETIKKYYKTRNTGVLVVDIDIEEKQLKVNDIIIRANGYKISSKSKLFSFFHKKQVGESLLLSVFRNERIVNIDYRLNYSKGLLHQEFIEKPRYFIFGGLVFTPLTRNYLQSIGMTQYEMDMLFYEQKRSLEYNEPLAWIERKFSHNINKGYNSKVEIVDKVNNIKVKDINHFINIIESSKEKFIVIDFIKKQRVILEKREAIKSFQEIKNKYNISSDRNL